jgi:hypothetical protein
MFVSCGICISTLCAALRSLLISFDFIFLVLSWFAFYVLNVIVSIVTKSDKPIVDHLFPCLVNSALSLPAYVGFCAALGVVALFVGSSVHRFVRASMNATIMLEGLILLHGMTWFNSVMLGIELYLVNYPLSDTIGIVIFAALTVVLPSWILTNTDSYLTSNFPRRSKFSILRAVLVCLMLFAIPPVVTYKVIFH